jgi:hydroxymethylpyrimidine/phosphomethylpyrimidine kinase
MARPPRALTIAGSDPSGGAGLQADLKTFAAHRVYGMAVVTALTAQNSQGVQATHAIPADFVAAQLDSVLSDLGADAVKTGMLGSAEVVEAVAAKLQEYRVANVVVDPVMIAKGGAPLLSTDPARQNDALRAMRERLIPRAMLVTPNLPEAAALWGRPVTTPAEQREAARALADLGAAVLVKGGHLEGTPLDVFCDGSEVVVFRGERIPGGPVHGTGCMLAAAITARLARGETLRDAVVGGRLYLRRAIRQATNVGSGMRYLVWR